MLFVRTFKREHPELMEAEELASILLAAEAAKAKKGTRDCLFHTSTIYLNNNIIFYVKLLNKPRIQIPISGQKNNVSLISVTVLESFKPLPLLRGLMMQTEPFDEDGPTYLRHQVWSIACWARKC